MFFGFLFLVFVFFWGGRYKGTVSCGATLKAVKIQIQMLLPEKMGPLSNFAFQATKRGSRTFQDPWFVVEMTFGKNDDNGQ